MLRKSKAWMVLLLFLYHGDLVSSKTLVKRRMLFPEGYSIVTRVPKRPALSSSNNGSIFVSTRKSSHIQFPGLQGNSGKHRGALAKISDEPNHVQEQSNFPIPEPRRNRDNSKIPPNYKSSDFASRQDEFVVADGDENEDFSDYKDDAADSEASDYEEAILAEEEISPKSIIVGNDDLCNAANASETAFLLLAMGLNVPVYIFLPYIFLTSFVSPRHFAVFEEKRPTLLGASSEATFAVQNYFFAVKVYSRTCHQKLLCQMAARREEYSPLSDIFLSEFKNLPLGEVEADKTLQGYIEAKNTGFYESSGSCGTKYNCSIDLRDIVAKERLEFVQTLQTIIRLKIVKRN